jgi:hypothetical protein
MQVWSTSNSQLQGGCSVKRGVQVCCKILLCFVMLGVKDLGAPFEYHFSTTSFLFRQRIVQQPEVLEVSRYPEH